MREDAERNRRRVLVGARELFAVKGIEATLNDLAQHIGLGVATVYRRFASKDKLIDALFEDALDEVARLAEAALQQDNSWEGFVWFVEQQCALTAVDRGLREMVYSNVYGRNRVERARERIVPLIAQVVERARVDGHLRPDIQPSDAFVLGLVAGTVNEWAGDVAPELWRRYVVLMLEGMRYRLDGCPADVEALNDDQIEEAIKSWDPCS